MNDNGNVIGCKFFDYPTCQECEYRCKSKRLHGLVVVAGVLVMVYIYGETVQDFRRR